MRLSLVLARKLSILFELKYALLDPGGSEESWVLKRAFYPLQVQIGASRPDKLWLRSLL